MLEHIEQFRCSAPIELAHKVLEHTEELHYSALRQLMFQVLVHMQEFHCFVLSKVFASHLHNQVALEVERCSWVKEGSLQ